MRYFNSSQLSAIDNTRQRAEELTGDFFKLGSFDPARYPYEVATLRDLDEPEIAPAAFAQLLRYGRNRLCRPKGKLALRHYYRIGLHDENLLERRAEGTPLEPLLLYVMTHELIHIVRFEHFAELFHSDGDRRGHEERRVHELTARIVKPLRNSTLDRMIGVYGGDSGSLCGHRGHEAAPVS